MTMQLCLRFGSVNQLVAATCLAVCATSAAARVNAQQACSALPNPVLIAGSTAVKPLIAKLAAELQAQNPPTTIVVASSPTGSCAGVKLMTGERPGTLSGTGSIFDQDGKEQAAACALNDDPVDLVLSDVWPATCDDSRLPATVKDFYGPVQTMTFVVPVLSSKTIISAEAAYLVFGLGVDGEVAPWVDPLTIAIRDVNSGTQQMIAKAIKVPAAKFQGTSVGSMGSGGILTALKSAATSGNADKAIGILATDRADGARSDVRILGYQHYGQTCAYWPDSGSTSFDKLNVRDGHYPIWGPLHMLALVKDGVVQDEQVKTVVDYLSGAQTPSFDLVEQEAKGGLIPQCAMRVTRNEELGPMASFQPDKPCTCKFLDAFGTAPSECTSCDSDTDCQSDSACNYGFCEKVK